MTDDSIKKFLDAIGLAYKQDQADKGMVSSGKSAASIRTELTDDGGQVWGSSYIYQQIHGRKPGKFPPIEDMLQYIFHKGITPDDPKTSYRELAFLFGRKIAEVGTDIYTGKRPGLSIESKLVDLKKNFKDEYLGAFKAKLADHIRQIISTV